MPDYVFRSLLTDLLCNATVSPDDLPPHVPLLSPVFFFVCYAYGGLMILSSFATFLAWWRIWSQTQRLSNAVVMLSTATVTCWCYGGFYLLGGGVHRPGDFAVRNASVYLLFLGGFVLNTSTVLWNESKQNLMAFSALPAHKQRRQKLVLRTASMLPMGCTSLFAFVIVWMPSYDCFPLVTIFRLCSIGTFLVVAIVGPLNYYYLRKSVQALEWMREQSTRDPEKAAQLADTISKVKRQSGTVLFSGPPNLAFSVVIIVLPYLEDVPWFYALIMSMQALTILGCAGNTFVVFYWNKASRSSTAKASPSTHKSSSKPRNTKVNSSKVSPSNAIKSNWTDKDSISSTGF